MNRSFDAIVIGAGHNGLVAAALLARAGWSTIVLERGAVPGGAVQSGQLTLPGFTHDLFATNMNLFVASPAYAELGSALERNGLRFAVSDRPFASVFPNGVALRAYRDLDRTVADLGAHNPGDGEGIKALASDCRRLAPVLMDLYGTPAAPLSFLASLARAGRRLGAAGIADLAALALSSTGELGDQYFVTEEAKAMVGAWGMHLDYAPDVAGGALFPFLEVIGNIEAGMSIVVGGASRLIDALTGVILEAGGELRCEAEVAQIRVREGRADAVVLASGETITARRAVIANLTPAVLYGRLLSERDVPDRVGQRMRRFRYGPGTAMVHLALSGAVPWQNSSDLSKFAYVHIGPYQSDMQRTYNDARAGLLPQEPMLVVGQASATDPSRAPGDQQTLWIQVRVVPSVITGDAAGAIEYRDWDAVREPFADRVMANLERYAPGLGKLVLGRKVFTPVDLEQLNPNLVGGDSLAGSMHLRQNFLLRPVPGLTKYRTGVDGLWMIGAATWPGAGVNALSGYHLAVKLRAAHVHQAMVPPVVKRIMLATPGRHNRSME
jgi:phytoene dehydrogenase-like protein